MLTKCVSMAVLGSVALASQSVTRFETGSNSTLCPPHDVCGTGNTCCDNAWSPNGYGCTNGTAMRCCLSLATPGALWPPQSTFACPADHTCNPTSPWGGTCIPPQNSTGNAAVGHPPIPVPSTDVCKAGVGALPMSKQQPNVVVLGDSVSIGYTPFVSLMLREHARAQHTPWDETDGGAGSALAILSCLDFWLRPSEDATALLDPAPALIAWNTGIHDVGGYVTNATEIPQYVQNVLSITARMQRTYPSSKLAFIATSPIPYDKDQDNLVVEMNKQVKEQMGRMGIPFIDLYGAVIELCGPTPYWDCPYALNSKKEHNPHYTPDGYIQLSQGTLVPGIRAALGA